MDNGTQLRELTLRGIIIGGLITLVFTAANVYLLSLIHISEPTRRS